MILFPKEMIELKENVKFIIMKHRVFLEKYQIVMSVKTDAERSFDWENGAIIGHEGFYVSFMDLPRVWMEKYFANKKEALEFIDRIPKEMEFSKLAEVEYGE